MARDGRRGEIKIGRPERKSTERWSRETMEIELDPATVVGLLERFDLESTRDLGDPVTAVGRRYVLALPSGNEPNQSLSPMVFCSNDGGRSDWQGDDDGLYNLQRTERSGVRNLLDNARIRSSTIKDSRSSAFGFSLKTDL
ncbi:hypothetical protein MRB53_028424 [Persea americana]|uniref:Uncharacterized protein n=1 Tax=Persea americana TaxID=3435 RepID=A0ACC2KFI3_PERAE|nr:hypothetical protein MRB53_028424 [Persea americana]